MLSEQLWCLRMLISNLSLSMCCGFWFWELVGFFVSCGLWGGASVMWACSAHPTDELDWDVESLEAGWMLWSLRSVLKDYLCSDALSCWGKLLPLRSAIVNGEVCMLYLNGWFILKHHPHGCQGHMAEHCIVTRRYIYPLHLSVVLTSWLITVCQLVSLEYFSCCLLKYTGNTSYMCTQIYAQQVLCLLSSLTVPPSIA